MQLRWLAVAGQIATILYVHFHLEVELPLTEMSAVLVFLITLNLVSILRDRLQEQVANAELFVELLLDVGALTLQLYLSGGAANPFVSLYLLQVTIAAVLLDVWSVWALVAITFGCFLWLATHFRALPLETAHTRGGTLLDLHIQGLVVCFGLAACLIAFFIIRIQANLKEQATHLAELRQRSAEEDHIVRMGLLASGAAHELGTPLATLSVILNDWRRMPQLRASPELSEEMDEMRSQLERCKSIVSGILMSSGDARGEGTLRTTAADFLDDTIEEWRESRSPRDLRYDATIEPDEPIVSDTALKQVLFNVLDNALEASPEHVRVAAERHGDDIVIRVSDRGQGFTPAMLAEFGKPYRSTKKRPGSGLGLFLVVNVIRKLGGTVDASNESTGGACVRLTLPLSALATGEHGAG